MPIPSNSTRTGNFIAFPGVKTENVILDPSGRKENAMRFWIFLVAALSLAQTEQPGAALLGSWESNFTKSQLPANYQYRRLKLQFATMLDTVTVGGTFILSSGQEVITTELFHFGWQAASKAL